MIGAFTGAAVWRLGHDLGLPDMANIPGVFVVVGMMACFSSVDRTTLAVTIMVAEMTDSFSVVPGAMSRSLSPR